MTKPLSEYEKARRFAAKMAANRATSDNVPGSNELVDNSTPVRGNRSSTSSQRRAEMLRYRAFPSGGV